MSPMRELTDQELDAVTGGCLIDARSVTGVVIAEQPYSAAAAAHENSAKIQFTELCPGGK
jgi:bacteriocin-like protein